MVVRHLRASATAGTIFNWTQTPLSVVRRRLADGQPEGTFLGGPEPGRHGRVARGKTMVEIAVEQDGHGLGRSRKQIIENATPATLTEFRLAHVEPRATVISDGLTSYTQTVRSARQ